MSNPRVTVLMPVYNGEKYLREAMESILGQTYTDFEFLIINDGSTDRSVEIIESYPDARIRLVHNEKNINLIATLNKGIELARGEYIARMDCDDISLPDRLAKQVAFMDAHPEIGGCGTWAKVIDEKGNVYKSRKALTGKSIKRLRWIPTPFIHPTIMARTSLLKENRYSEGYLYAEDYELWLRLCRETEIFNLKDYLLYYRIHPDNVSSSKREQQLISSYKAFLSFTGDGRISYEDFLALISVEVKVNPVKRSFYWWLASKASGFDIKIFIKDNARYTLLWSRSFWCKNDKIIGKDHLSPYKIGQ